MRERDVAEAALAVIRTGGAGVDLDQYHADAAVGRALREAAEVDQGETLIHVCGFRPSGAMWGSYLGDDLAFHRRALADAASALIEAARGRECDPHSPDTRPLR